MPTILRVIRHKSFIIAVLAAATVRCEDAATEVSGPYVPPQVRGDDGRRLVWEPGAEDPKQPYEPDFSPDGTKVVVSYRNGIWGRDADIAILDLATRELKVILGGNSAVRPQWSPDGEWIAYQSNHPSHFGCTLWKVRKDGSENQKLELGTDWGYLPYWSPSADKIFFVGHYVPREPMYALWYDLEAKELGVLRKPVNEFHHNMAAPSPLGDKVALGLMAREGYVKHAVKNVVLAFINTDGSDFKVVWAEPADAAPEPGEPRDWSPDGKYVLLRFEPSLGTGNSLWTYEVKTGVVRQLTMCPPEREYDHVMYGSWGPNGDIVFGTDEGWLYLIKAPK